MSDRISRDPEVTRIYRRQRFWVHFAVFATIQVFMVVIWVVTDGTHPWFIYPLFGWGLLIAIHAVYAFVVKTPEEIMVGRDAGGGR